MSLASWQPLICTPTLFESGLAKSASAREPQEEVAKMRILGEIDRDTVNIRVTF